MPRWLANSLLIAASFAAALYLHLGFGGSNPDLTQTETIQQTAAGPVVQIEAFRIVGIQARVSFGDSGEIEVLWQRFNDATALHASLDWSHRQTAIAYYDQFDTDSNSASLIIGYPESSLTRPVDYPHQQVEAGTYLHWDLANNSLDLVTQTWNDILTQVANPRAVLERYGMDAWGQTTRIQIQALQ